MNAETFMNQLFRQADPDPAHYEKTCDTLKAGDPAVELSRVAVAMFGTPEVIRQAAAWGAQLLIVHEPMFFDHWDGPNDWEVAERKRALLKELGLTVYRYHDHLHHRTPDGICEGQLHALGLTGKFRLMRWAVNRMTLDEPITPVQLARLMNEKLHIAHPRVCGNAELPMTRLSLCFGTPGGVFEELRDPEVELVLTGETCEWQLAEYAREAAEFGMAKAMIVMGHVGSERDGMRLLAEQLPATYPALQFRYFECGEVYLP